MKVLIVESELLIAWAIQEELEALGYEVVKIAKTVSQAVVILQDCSVDLVLISLPPNVEDTPYRYILNQGLSSYFIFLTTSVDQQSKDWQTAPPDRVQVLRKPFLPQELVRWIASLYPLPEPDSSLSANVA
uniref:Response regulator receiver protein n=1 Tax=Cyanothece sp. (strain PCC 7425 / ATCC 29141) TaxID=395961 RepID=B8HQM3_CYAP4